jgi:hypothetical protein
MTRRDAQLFAGALQQLRSLRHLARHDAHLLAYAVRRVV